MSKIINKKILVLFLLVVLFVLLVFIMATRLLVGDTNNISTTTSDNKRVPVPTFIPDPKIITDSENATSKPVISWELDDTELVLGQFDYYFSPISTTDPERVNFILEAFGFTGQGQALSESPPIRSWSTPGRTLQIHFDSKYISYTSTITRGKSDTDGIVKKEISTDEEALRIATEFLNKVKITSDGITLIPLSIFKVGGEGEPITDPTPESPFYYRIQFSYKLNTFPVFFQRGNNEFAQVTIDQLGEVVQLHFWDLAPIPANKTVSSQELEEIKEKVLNGNYPYSFSEISGVISTPTLTQIILTKGTVGYLYDFSSPFFFPVLVLIGRGEHADGIENITITIPLASN